MPDPDLGSPLFVADNLALDFINTSHGEGSGHRELLTTDANVLAWLRAAGVISAAVDVAVRSGDRDRTPEGLLEAALLLRRSASALVDAWQLGAETDTSVVNDFLSRGFRPTVLQWNAQQQRYMAALQIQYSEPASLLEPVARALLELITQAQPSSVKRCSGHHCTLLFRDLSKSGRRRWCSMAECGNKMKVAAFRARQRDRV